MSEIDCNIFWMDPACMYPTGDMSVDCQDVGQQQSLPASVSGAWLYNLNQTVKTPTPLVTRFQTSPVSPAEAPPITGPIPTPGEAFQSAKKVVMNLYGDAGAYLDRLAYGSYVGGVDTLQVYLLEHYLRAEFSGQDPVQRLAWVLGSFSQMTGAKLNPETLAFQICQKFSAIPLGSDYTLYSTLEQLVARENLTLTDGLFLDSLEASNYLLNVLADDSHTSFYFMDCLKEESFYGELLKPMFHSANTLVSHAWSAANNTEGPEDFAALEAFLPSYKGRSLLIGNDGPYPTSEGHIKKAGDWIQAKQDADFNNAISLMSLVTFADPVIPSGISKGEWDLAMSIAQSRMEHKQDEAFAQVGRFVLIGLGTVAAAALAPESGGGSFAALSAAVTGGTLSAGVGLKEKWDLLQQARAFDLADKDKSLDGKLARAHAEQSFEYQKGAAGVEVAVSATGTGVVSRFKGVAAEALTAGAEGMLTAVGNGNVTDVDHVREGEMLEAGTASYTVNDAAVQVIFAGGVAALTAGLAGSMLGGGQVNTGKPDVHVPTEAANNVTHYGDEVMDAPANNNWGYTAEMDLPLLGTGTEGFPVPFNEQPSAIVDRSSKGPKSVRPTRERLAEIQRKRQSARMEEVAPRVSSLKIQAHEGQQVIMDDGLVYYILDVNDSSVLLSNTPSHRPRDTGFMRRVSLSELKYDFENNQWVSKNLADGIASAPVPAALSHLNARDYLTHPSTIRNMFQSGPVQNNVGNCWVVSVFNALYKYPYFNELMATSLEGINGGYRIYFPLGQVGRNREYVDVLFSELGSQGGLHQIYSDTGWQVLEVAFEKRTGLNRAEINKGGYSDEALRDIMGDRIHPVAVRTKNGISFKDSGDPIPRDLALSYLRDFKKEGSILTAGSCSHGGKKFTVGSHTFFSNHAYMIRNVAMDSHGEPSAVVLVNPHTPQVSILVDIKDFLEAFNGIEGGEINTDKIFK